MTNHDIRLSDVGLGDCRRSASCSVDCCDRKATREVIEYQSPV